MSKRKLEDLYRIQSASNADEQEDEEHPEVAFRAAKSVGDAAAASIALQRLLRHWHESYAQDFRVAAHEALIGPTEVLVAEPLVMHEYAKLTEASYIHYEHGHEIANTFMKDPAHGYIDGFHKWEIDRELSTRDNLVFVQKSEAGVAERVAVAYRGTIAEPATSLKNVETTVREWTDTNLQFVLGNEEGTRRMANADAQMVKVINKYGREKITVTGHSQGGGVSAYMAEKYNVPGHHYQPAMYWESKRRVLGTSKKKPTTFKESERTPLLEGDKRTRIEGVPLKQSERSIYGSERNVGFLEEGGATSADDFLRDVFEGPRAQQNIYRTRGDIVSSLTISGVEKNKNYKVNTINSLWENHDHLGDIHSHGNFHPPPAAEESIVRSSLVGAEQEVGTVLVKRASTSAAIKGIAKGLGGAAAVGLTVKDTVDNFNKFMNDPNLSKGDKATLGSLELAKQGGMWVAADAAGSAAGAAAGAALAGMAPAIIASGGAALVAIVAGAVVAVGINMLGEVVKDHYKEIEHGFEKMGKGVAKGFKKMGKAIGGLFHKHRHHSKKQNVPVEPPKPEPAPEPKPEPEPEPEPKPGPEPEPEPLPEPEPEEPEVPEVPLPILPPIPEEPDEPEEPTIAPTNPNETMETFGLPLTCFVENYDGKLLFGCYDEQGYRYEYNGPQHPNSTTTLFGKWVGPAPYANDLPVRVKGRMGLETSALDSFGMMYTILCYEHGQFVDEINQEFIARIVIAISKGVISETKDAEEFEVATRILNSFARSGHLFDALHEEIVEDATGTDIQAHLSAKYMDAHANMSYPSFDLMEDQESALQEAFEAMPNAELDDVPSMLEFMESANLQSSFPYMWLRQKYYDQMQVEAAFQDLKEELLQLNAGSRLIPTWAKRRDGVFKSIKPQLSLTTLIGDCTASILQSML